MSPLYQYIYAANGWYLYIGAIVTAIVLVFVKQQSERAFGFFELFAGFYLLEVATAFEGRGAFSPGFSSGFDRVQVSVTLVATIAAILILVDATENIRSSGHTSP